MLETALEKMAAAVASEHIPRGAVVGMGSGSTVARFAVALGRRNAAEHLGITIVPSSMQAWFLARENGLSLHADSAHCPESIDVAVDGADQISTTSRSKIKGGGGALLKEKILLTSARESYILADEAKFVDLMTRAVPVEVTQFALTSVEHKLISQLGAIPHLRKLDKGYPFYTESGNVILDSTFQGGIPDPVVLERSIKMIPGVVEAGLFNCPVNGFYQARSDGSYSRL